eukprot:7681_1
MSQQKTHNESEFQSKLNNSALNYYKSLLPPTLSLSDDFTKESTRLPTCVIQNTTIKQDETNINMWQNTTKQNQQTFNASQTKSKLMKKRNKPKRNLLLTNRKCKNTNKKLVEINNYKKNNKTKIYDIKNAIAFNKKYEFSLRMDAQQNNILNVRNSNKIYTIKRKQCNDNKFVAMKYYFYEEHSIKQMKEKEHILCVWYLMKKLGWIENGQMYHDTKSNSIILTQYLFMTDLKQYIKRHTKLFFTIHKHENIDDKNMFKNNINENMGLLMKTIIPKLKILHCKGYVFGGIKLKNLWMDKNNHKPLKFGFYNYRTCCKDNTPFVNVLHLYNNNIEYNPPELFKIDKENICISKSYDIWSLGIALLYLINGDHPFMYDLQMEYGEERVNKGLLDGVITQEYIDENIKLNHVLIQKKHKLFKNLLLKMLRVNVKERCDINDIIHHEWYQNNCN